MIGYYSTSVIHIDNFTSTDWKKKLFLEPFTIQALRLNHQSSFTIQALPNRKCLTPLWDDHIGGEDDATTICETGHLLTSKGDAHPICRAIQSICHSKASTCQVSPNDSLKELPTYSDLNTPLEHGPLLFLFIVLRAVSLSFKNQLRHRRVKSRTKIGICCSCQFFGWSLGQFHDSQIELQPCHQWVILVPTRRYW